MVTETPRVCYRNFTEISHVPPTLRGAHIDPQSYSSNKIRQGCLYTKYRSAATCGVVEIVVYFFSSAIPRGSGNHTLTGSVGDQWHESRNKMVVTLADGPFKYKFINTNVLISIKISLKFVPRGPINNIPALVQIMAWYRPGDKPLSEPMMVSLLPHICITRPPWVNTCRHICRCIFLNYVFSSRVSLTYV